MLASQTEVAMRRIRTFHGWLFCWFVILGGGCTRELLQTPDAVIPDVDAGPRPEAGPATDAFVPIRRLVGLRIEPADPVIDVRNGDVSGLDLAFSAVGVYDDGSTAAGSCDWSLDAYVIGDLRDFLFRPYGTQGGTTTVRCVTPDHEASTSVTVRLRHLSNTAGISDAELASLTSSVVADPAVTRLLYPYDRTVFPRGLGAAPEVMWAAPAAGDVYALTYSEQFASATWVFTADDPARSQLPLDVWSSLQASNDGRTPLEVTLYRLAGGAGGTAYRGPQHRWTLSTANLGGSVLYWEASRAAGTGGTRRLPLGGAPSEVVTGTCIGCHAVSRDGSVLAAGETSSGSHTGWDLPDGMSRFHAGTQSGYRAVSPDGDVIAWVPCGRSDPDYQGEPLAFSDSATGTELAETGLESMGLTNTPAFSQLGDMIAFSIRTGSPEGTYHNVFRDSDLGIARFDATTRRASDPRVLFVGEGLEFVGHPSFTPDDAHVAFQRGTQSRNRAGAGNEGAWSDEPSLADLWMIGTDGGALVRLEQASNGGVLPVDRRHSYHPIVSPVAQGGYFWVVFTSLRTYGNRHTITADHNYRECTDMGFENCRAMQLWVAAIDISSELDADPSHPAFWLPGQLLDHSNFDAYWSLDACRPTGESCEAGFECCEGACLHDDTGASPTGRVCGAPGACSADTDACETTADCCTGLICVGTTCTPDTPL